MVSIDENFRRAEAALAKRRRPMTRHLRGVTVELHGNLVTLSTCTIDRRHGDGWRCDVCGKIERWGPGWHSFGPLYEDSECLTMACSVACMDVVRPHLPKGPR